MPISPTLILAALLLSAHAPAPRRAALAPPAPAVTQPEVLHFDLKTMDLGMIGDDEPVIRPFPFTNATERTIRVAMSYCHFCAAPMLDKTVLKPGESATVVLELDPAGKRGPYSASVSIAEEGRPNTAVEVMLKAEICPRVWVEPINMFPRIVRGKDTTGTFSITGRAGKFKVEKVESDMPMGSIDIGPITEVDDCGSKARHQDITVHYPKDLPLGRFANTFRVLTADDDAHPKVVTVDGVVTGRLSFDPPTLSMLLTPGEAFSKSFDVVADEGPLMLHALDVQARDEAQDLAIDAHPTADPNRYRVTVSGRAPYRERQSVDIRINVVGSTLADPGEETLTVPINLVVFFRKP